MFLPSLNIAVITVIETDPASDRCEPISSQGVGGPPSTGERRDHSESGWPDDWQVSDGLDGGYNAWTGQSHAGHL